MTTDAAKRAAEALNKRREAEGLKRVTVWLSKEARFKLDAMKAVAGSKDKAADAAILAWSGPHSGSAIKMQPLPKLGLGDTATGLGGGEVRVSRISRIAIQVGPIHAKPGERAKKPKASK